MWRAIHAAQRDECGAAYSGRETELNRALARANADLLEALQRLPAGADVPGVALVPLPPPSGIPLTDEQRALMPPEYDFAGNRLDAA